MDHLLEFNDYPVLQGAGNRSSDQAKTHAHERYSLFDTQRRREDLAAADAEDLRMLEDLEKDMKGRKGG